MLYLFYIKILFIIIIIVNSDGVADGENVPTTTKLYDNNNKNVTPPQKNPQNKFIVPLDRSKTQLSIKSFNDDISATDSITDLVKNLDLRLKNIRNNELGVPTVQEVFDAMDFTYKNTNIDNKIIAITKRMSSKLENAKNIMFTLSNFFQINITESATANIILNKTTNNIYLRTRILPSCPFKDYNSEQNYNKEQIEILNILTNNGGEYHHHHNNENNNTSNIKYDNNFIENEQIYKILKNNLDENHIKNIYYLSRWDHSSDQYCKYYFNNINFRYLYATGIQNKHIFLLIDINTYNYEQLELSKIFVTNILQMLSYTDTITIVLISDKVKAMILSTNNNDKSDDDDIHKYIYPITIDNKKNILNFIKNLNYSSTITNHSAGFEYSFELLKRQNFTTDKPIVFVYVTKGLINKLTDSENVLKSIAFGQSKLKFPIVINTCAVILDEKRIMYEKQFLNDIAQQNYTKYGINVSHWYNQMVYNLSGRLYIVTKQHPENIIKTSSAIFEGLFTGEKYIKLYTKHYIEDKLIYHQPILDYNNKDIILSITRPIQQFGVIGLNLYLNDIAEDIIYFKASTNSYAFMINTNGIVIYHPSFSRSTSYLKNTFNVDIGMFENTQEFNKNVRFEMIQNDYGNVTILGKNIKETITYNWRTVLNIYIVCIVTTSRIRKSSFTTKFSGNLNYKHYNLLPPLELLYHRLDLISTNISVCRHFRQIATLDTGTVFLSASSFQSPFNYLRNNHVNKNNMHTSTAQSIMAYIKDSTSLLANPGLLPQIRTDVSALYHVMIYLKKRHLENGPFRKYIIRRYAATTNGVLQVYPGCILETEFEPSKRPWYRKAIKNPAKIIVTEPYLDAGGAGYILTIAHTIFEGKFNALHNAEEDFPVAIVAIDVPYGFLYKLIIESSPFCSDSFVKCFLMEDNGYMLAHPSFMEPATINLNSRRPMEHITHKESFVANDILNHKHFVKKRVCANYQNRTVHRYYTFNTSLTEVLTNVVHGDRTKYQISIIHGTNIFAAVLNSTCDGGAFCPCSTVDRICLNCNRLDQSDCECPCECPLKISNNNNSGNFDEPTDKLNTIYYDYCESISDNNLPVLNSLNYDLNSGLKACVNINCDLYQTHNDCYGVMGCEWCQFDIEGNPFSSEFCTNQNACFNGVLGSITPYGDNDLGPNIIEQTSSQTYSTIGPVGGAIIVSLIIVGFAMYCYRQNLDNSSDQLYQESIQDNNYGLPLSRFNYDDLAPCNDNNDLIGDNNHTSNILQKNLIHPLVANSETSPYHMSPGYRRPNGESDNGYSTMTPHEDSEHMCFNLVEPLINSNRRLSMSADSMSINTSVSNPSNTNTNLNDHKLNNIIGTTRFVPSSPARTTEFNKGQSVILAPVTFHRHMEA